MVLCTCASICSNVKEIAKPSLALGSRASQEVEYR